MLGQLADRVSPRILHAPRRLDEAARQLEEYFAGRRTKFDLPLDLRLSAGFRRSVLELPAGHRLWADCQLPVSGRRSAQP